MNSQAAPSGRSLYRWSAGRAARSAAISATSIPSMVSGARSRNWGATSAATKASDETGHGQGARGRDRDQADGGLQDGDAAAFGAGEGAGQVEPVLRQQLVQVVAGHPPGQLGRLRADQITVGGGQLVRRR